MSDVTYGCAEEVIQIDYSNIVIICLKLDCNLYHLSAQNV